MNALFISLDKNLLSEKQGDALKRHLRYSKYFNLLNIIVFTKKGDGFSESRSLEENLHISPSNSSSRWLYVVDALRVARSISQRQQIDVVSTQDPFITAIVGIVIKLLSGAHLNVQIHNDYQSPYWKTESLQNRIFSLMLPITLRLADSIRAVSQATAIIAPDPDRVFISPIAIDTKFFKPQEMKKDYDIVCVTRMDKQKNIPLLINALSDLKGRFPKIKAVIVGGGERRIEVERLVRERGLRNNVTLIGGVDRKKVRSLLWKSKIFVLPSNYEGWGLAAVEAAACGLPVVMTDTGGANEIVKERKTGFTVPVNDKRQLIEKLSLILKDEKKQKTMGKLARRWVEKLSLLHKKDKFIIDLIRSTQPG